jgi:hypothetical protein
MLTLAVAANDLRMGQGYVRCGRCANVFNALLTLSEEPVDDHPAAAPPTPADRASHSQITAAMGDAPVETSAASSEPHLQVATADGPSTQLPTEHSSDGSIENESTYAEGTGTFETIVLEGEAITQIEEYVTEASVDSEIAAMTQRLEMSAHEPTAATEPGLEGASGLEPAPEPGAEGMLEPASTPASRWLPRQRWPWVTASAALALLLALQLIHHWRDALAASPPFTVPLTRAYAALGMPLDPHWDLSAYDVRQQGAVADPNDSQLIRVRLSLANHATRAQPLPMLRLTLLDRYGKRMAASDLAPEQYWPAGAPPRAFLGHDERVDSEITVRDPSAASASFELDVCLRNANGILRCAGDLGPK